MSLRAGIALAASVALGALAAGPARARSLADHQAPERFVLGTNGTSDVCVATRQWTQGSGPILRAEAQPFAITCNGLAAAEAQAYVSPAGAPSPGTDLCGGMVTVTLAGIGPAEARRCFDQRLGKLAIDLRFTVKGHTFHGAAVEPSLGVLAAALRVIVRGDRPPAPGVAPASGIDLAAIPAAPQGLVVTQGGNVTPEAALSEGLAAMQSGRMLDASRILNDALRAFAGSEAGTRIDLRLAAGLADSNLSQFELADQHFAVAGDLLRANPGIASGAQREKQLLTYRGLHLINQRQWTEAIAVLTSGAASDETGTTLGPEMVNRLNEEAAVGQDALQSSLSDATLLSRNLVEAQRDWALSVAYLGLGRVAEADRALDAAAGAARVSIQRIAPERIVWMRAAIERQKGRVLSRQGRIDPALVHLDCAIAALRGRVPAAGACVFGSGRPVPDTYQNAALLVETQLERASIAARSAGHSPASVLRDYDAALASLANLTGAGYVSLASLERYFALLTRAPASAERDEDFFRAMQMTGEPAIAREYAQLQKVVSASPEVGDLLRQRSLLERQLIRLRTAITDAEGGDAAMRDRLAQDRQAADGALAEVNAKLLATNGIGALQDTPATVASIRAALGPGEAYLKLVALDQAMFGIVIGKEQTAIYQVGRSLAEVERLAERVLASARAGEGVIRPFDVQGAADLYAMIAGPAAGNLVAASRVIYNPAGALRRLPLAILVDDRASAAAYGRQRLKGDYSQVAFVARRAETAVALSPRAFLRSRLDLGPSNAPLPFLGLGENAEAEPAPSAALAARRMPFDCSVTYGEWAQRIAGARPVSAHEIGVAARALGLADAPEIVRADFTDVNLVSGPASTRLDQYQILHFATHGLPETEVPMDQCVMRLPPALVTTLAAPEADGTVASDGFLSFDEVARLRLNANLVVLSACDTAASASARTALRAGVEGSSQALDGLVRSFIAARARAVMATFWAVPAIPQSDDLMAAFYSAGRTGSIAYALKTAQGVLEAQPRFSHPYFWGAYFVVGDGAKSMLSPRVAAR
ncbi:CHAT domain-containing protein [Novosphingobium bradum]|uniref:CHAT domain-containing protein n=1 Tax=Novosphingobium bradum TaxID=1737444 RepID=A0ABV7IPJ8_9SPHN